VTLTFCAVTHAIDSFFAHPVTRRASASSIFANQCTVLHKRAIARVRYNRYKHITLTKNWLRTVKTPGTAPHSFFRLFLSASICVHLRPTVFSRILSLDRLQPPVFFKNSAQLRTNALSQNPTEAAINPINI
jgi:hypothetical protein